MPSCAPSPQGLSITSTSSPSLCESSVGGTLENEKTKKTKGACSFDILQASISAARKTHAFHLHYRVLRITCIMSIQRWEKRPYLKQTTLSPGESVLVRAASQPPVPVPGKMKGVPSLVW